MDLLAEVEVVEVAAEFLVRTGDVLRAYGERNCEGLLLWAGHVNGTRATVRRVIEPVQTPIQEELGVGYFVEVAALLSLSRLLATERLRLIAQVHSHPREAFHSDTDDRFAIVTESGGFSLVVPDFACRPMSLGECAVYRLSRGDWLRLGVSEVAATFRVD